MNSLSILLIVWFHWFSDFVLQSNHQAINKSKNNGVLFDHVMTYATAMAIIGIYLGHNQPTFLDIIWFSLEWTWINALLHFITDYFTSRLTSMLWVKEERHWFFVVIGIDQAIHMSCLILTYQLLLTGHL